MPICFKHQFLPNTSTKILLLATSAAGLLFAHQALYADIYKWKDNQGRALYSDQKPSTATQEKDSLITTMQAKELCSILPLSRKVNVTGVNGIDFLIPTKINDNTANQLPLNDVKNSAGKNNSLLLSKTDKTNKKTNQGFSTSVTTTSQQGLKNDNVGRTSTSKLVSWANTNLTKPATTTTPTTTTSNITLATATTTSTPTPSSSVSTSTNTSTPTKDPMSMGYMPYVDISKVPVGFEGYSDIRVSSTTEAPTYFDGLGGAFRIVCEYSHMSNDDPIVYPGVKGAAHHHTFFGNTGTNYLSTPDSIKFTGNSTCNGGIINRSAYWVPSMIDTSTGTPLKPVFAIFYYKTGFSKPQYITTPPKGLRMIAGDPKSSAPTDSFFTCRDANYNNLWNKESIEQCAKGNNLSISVGFPQCWDGKNLDSPDHKSHMAHADETIPTYNHCPTTHPVALPQIGLSVTYDVTTVAGTTNWRLSSDNYPISTKGGFSAHADWFNGWDEKFMQLIVDNCLKAAVDCHSYLIGDGKMIY